MPEHVRQLASQVLQILLSAVSPYSLLKEHVLPQVLVPLLPQVGEGHWTTQIVPLRYFGELQVWQVISVPEQVRQLLSQVLQIRLSDVSPNSLEFAQEISQVLVPLLPHFGDGH